MKEVKELPQRKPLRWNNYDYNTPGAYFITICTHDKRCTLSHVVGAIHESPAIKLTNFGQIVEHILHHIPAHLKATVDRFVIMPNHIHLLLVILDDEELRAIRESPLRGRSVISKTVGYIKMNATRQIHEIHDDVNVWQRGFHDHVIRDHRDYEKIAKYIDENPAQWERDRMWVKE